MQDVRVSSAVALFTF